MTPEQAAALGIHIDATPPASVRAMLEADAEMRDRARDAQEPREPSPDPKAAPEPKRPAPKRTGAQAKRAASTSGRTAKRAGDAAEALVTAACDEYRRRGVADVRKRPTPWRIVRSLGDGRFECVPDEKAGVDYEGPIFGGRAVKFELKSSRGPSLPLTRYGKPVLSESQAEELETAERLRAASGVLVTVVEKPRGRAPVRRWFWLTWRRWVDAVAEARRGGRRSLGVDLLAAYGIELGVMAGGAPDLRF